MELIGILQDHVEKLYELKRICDVNDFIITDPKIAKYLDTSVNPRSNIEKLLIQQDGNNLDISLYIDESLLSTLKRHNPIISLDLSNISAFLCVLEGVSHFVYLTWHANYDQPVSLFELELQAEVDKFVTCVLLLKYQNIENAYDQLYQQIFLDVNFDSSLTAEELLRYQNANYYAALYCQKIKSLFRRFYKRSFLNELRRFYRMNHWSKPAYINK